MGCRSTPVDFCHPDVRNRPVIEDVARMAERWTHRHRTIFRHELSERKPLILYADDADFQQTNVISGRIGTDFQTLNNVSRTLGRP